MSFFVVVRPPARSKIILARMLTGIQEHRSPALGPGVAGKLFVANALWTMSGIVSDVFQSFDVAVGSAEGMICPILRIVALWLREWALETMCSATSLLRA